MPTPPGSFPIWVPSGDPAFMLPIPSGQSDTGWVGGEAPPFQYQNYWQNLVNQWVVYFNSVITSETASTIPANSTVLTTTGSTASGVNQITGLASTTGILKGQAIVMTGVPSGTFVDAVSGTTVTMSQNASATNTSIAVAFNHQYATGAFIQTQLDELDATIFTRIYPYDVIVGGASVAAATHATLAAAVADANVGANKRVLLADSQSGLGSMTLTKAGWRISALPGVTYSGSGVGLIPSATGIWVEGLRMASFTTAVQFASAGTYGRVFNCNFASSVTLNVDDSAPPVGTLPLQYGNIQE